MKLHALICLYLLPSFVCFLVILSVNPCVLLSVCFCLIGEWSKQGLANGWASLGYTNDWRKPPSEEEQYKIKRARMVKHMQQCGMY